MKKVMFLSISVILLVITILATPVFAAKPDVPPGGPLNELWNALASLQRQIESEVTARILGDAAVAAAAQAANDTLQGLLGADIDAEEEARIAAEAMLQADLNQEIADRIADVNAEEAARLATAGALQEAINTEANARMTKDNNLQNQINAIRVPVMRSHQTRSADTYYDENGAGFVVASVLNNYGSDRSSVIGKAWEPGGSQGNMSIYDRTEGYGRASITFPVPDHYVWKVLVFAPDTAEVYIYWIPFN